MFSIGDFAKHGRVSVRMLRHYDGIGLLRPAHVDPHSGYRSYTGEQLVRLNRVIALKELGFTPPTRYGSRPSRRGSVRSKARAPCLPKTSSSRACPRCASPS